MAAQCTAPLAAPVSPNSATGYQGSRSRRAGTFRTVAHDGGPPFLGPVRLAVLIRDDPSARLLHTCQIGEERAQPHTRSICWRAEVRGGKPHAPGLLVEQEETPPPPRG